MLKQRFHQVKLPSPVLPSLHIIFLYIMKLIGELWTLQNIFLNSNLVPRAFPLKEGGKSPGNEVVWILFFFAY